jgi:serine/threonine protein kinase
MEEDLVCLFMEYIPGEVLDQIFLKRKVTVNEARDWFSQLMKALDHCHHQNVAHLDVKCENLILTPTGTLKLIDFGMSYILEPPSTSNPNTNPLTNPNPGTCECYRGSPLYMAPEIFARKPFNPFLSDAWASGIVYYRLLANGDFPWKSKTYSELIEEVLEETWSYPENIDIDNKAILKGLLEISPERRLLISEVMKKLELGENKKNLKVKEKGEPYPTMDEDI